MDDIARRFIRRRYGKGYDPTRLVCASHRVFFVEYRCDFGNASIYSHGCPVCVGLIRGKVQFEFARGPTANLRKGQRARKIAQPPRI